MIKFGLVLGAVLATLSGVGAAVSFCLFLVFDPWFWLVRLVVSLLLLVFVHYALPVYAANYVPKEERK